MIVQQTSRMERISDIDGYQDIIAILGLVTSGFTIAENTRTSSIPIPDGQDVL